MYILPQRPLFGIFRAVWQGDREGGVDEARMEEWIPGAVENEGAGKVMCEGG